MSDVAAKLRLRADAVKAAARRSYDVKLREVMYQTAENFEEAASEIERLRAEIAGLRANTPQ